MMKKTILIIVALFVVIALYWVTTYNKLVTANTGVDNQWAQVETQYQRRFDLIPNLVNSVQGAMAQEKDVFTAIADARTKYAGATNPDTKAAAATEVESAFARLLVVMENYPQLQSIGTVQTLMSEIEGAENRISVERGRYNDGVKNYNLLTTRIPSSIIAALSGFKSRAYFEAAAGADTVPVVNLTD